MTPATDRASRTPWRVTWSQVPIDGHAENGPEYHFGVMQGAKNIATVHPIDREGEEIAMHIARACNAHDALLAAAQDMDAMLIEIVDRGGSLPPASLPRLFALRDAIALAIGDAPG